MLVKNIDLTKELYTLPYLWPHFFPFISRYFIIKLTEIEIMHTSLTNANQALLNFYNSSLKNVRTPTPKLT